MSTKTVQQLKQEGSRVFLKHHKRFDGGYTTRVVIYNNGTVRYGEARAHTNDQFSRKIGRDIAIGRALSEKASQPGYNRAGVVNHITEEQLISFASDYVYNEAINIERD